MDVRLHQDIMNTLSSAFYPTNLEFLHASIGTSSQEPDKKENESSVNAAILEQYGVQGAGADLSFR